jgi:hypothetical protein
MKPSTSLRPGLARGERGQALLFVGLTQNRRRGNWAYLATAERLSRLLYPLFREMQKQRERSIRTMQLKWVERPTCCLGGNLPPEFGCQKQSRIVERDLAGVVVRQTGQFVPPNSLTRGCNQAVRGFGDGNRMNG